jgi:predicted alpha/beta superfamily hydrolase
MKNSALVLALGVAGCMGPIDGTIETHTLRSSSYSQTYTLYVFIPDGYAKGEQAQVVYLFDGDQWTDTTASIASALTRDGEITAPIVVGIGYGDRPNQRARDLTPAAKGIPAGHGGVDDFYGFLQEDLVPWVDSRWSTEPAPAARTVAGHSFGGVAAAWGLLQAPDTFGNAVMLSPSLVFGDSVIFDIEADYADAHSELRSRAYLSSGSQEAYGLAGLTEAFGDTLDAHDYQGLKLKTEIHRGRFHASLFPAGIEGGLAHVLGAK